MSYTGTGQFERVSAGSSSYTTGGHGLSRENSTSYPRDDAGLLISLRTAGGSFYYLLDGLGSGCLADDSERRLLAVTPA